MHGMSSLIEIAILKVTIGHYAVARIACAVCSELYVTPKCVEGVVRNQVLAALARQKRFSVVPPVFNQ